MPEHSPTHGAAVRNPQPVQFRIDEEKGDAASIVLAPCGELDLRVAPELRDRISAVIEDGADTIVIDLSAVTFIDSMALGVLVCAANKLEQLGGRLRLVVPAPELRRIFELTLLDRLFFLDSTREEAQTRLRDR
jgi:anti-sigma B factor antagonist